MYTYTANAKQVSNPDYLYRLIRTRTTYSRPQIARKQNPQIYIARYDNKYTSALINIIMYTIKYFDFDRPTFSRKLNKEPQKLNSTTFILCMQTQSTDGKLKTHHEE